MTAGLGVSVVGPTFPSPDRQPGLVARPFEPAISIELVLLYSAQRPLPLVGERFIEILYDTVGAKP